MLERLPTANTSAATPRGRRTVCEAIPTWTGNLGPGKEKIRFARHATATMSAPCDKRVLDAVTEGGSIAVWRSIAFLRSRRFAC